MNDGGQEAPAQKRRKIVLEGPAGFEKSKPPSRSKPVNLQRCELVTELRQTNAQGSIGEQVQHSSKPSSRKGKAAQFTALSHFEIEKAAPKSDKPLSSTSARRVTAASLLIPVPQDNDKSTVAKKPHDTSFGSRPLPQFTLPHDKSIDPKDKNAANKGVRQAPEFKLTDIFSEEDKALSSRLQRRPPLPPPGISDVHSTSSIPLYHLRPPPPPLPRPGSVKDEESSNLRTISTTGIAKATDLNTVNGNAELAHIFLQDQHPDISSAKPEWSIGLSPSKKASGGVTKGSGRFLRGGLAARAFDVNQRAQTDLFLWQKEVENRLMTQSTKHLGSHLRLRIIEILERPAGPKPTSPRKRMNYDAKPKPGGELSTQTAPGLAICRITSSSPPPSLTLDSAVSSSTRHAPPALLHAYEKRFEQNILVLLSFPRIAPSALDQRGKIYARNPESFAEGMEVHVWEPWKEVVLEPRMDPNRMDVDEMAEETKQYIPRPFPLPLSLPRSSQGSQPGVEKPLANVALLCDRFVIVT